MKGRLTNGAIETGLRDYRPHGPRRADREDFFEDPHEAANKLVGSLTTDELAQVMRIAGESGITGNKTEYVREVKDAFNNLYSFIKCPTFPCPDPDPFDA